VRLVLTSDTHVPARARDPPAELWQAIDSADAVVHAGDWMVESLLDAVQARSRQLIGVYGNNDGAALRKRLPEVARADLAGVRLAVVHETGPAAGREQRCATRFPDCDLLVFGHSHIPWDSVAGNGMRLLNPGSPTAAPAVRHPHARRHRGRPADRGDRTSPATANGARRGSAPGQGLTQLPAFSCSTPST
jgi:putative phosphoesterase